MDQDKGEIRWVPTWLSRGKMGSTCSDCFCYKYCTRLSQIMKLQFQSFTTTEHSENPRSSDPWIKPSKYRHYLAVSVYLGGLFWKRARSFRSHFNRGCIVILTTSTTPKMRPMSLQKPDSKQQRTFDSAPETESQGVQNNKTHPKKNEMDVKRTKYLANWFPIWLWKSATQSPVHPVVHHFPHESCPVFCCCSHRLDAQQPLCTFATRRQGNGFPQL